MADVAVRDDLHFPTARLLVLLVLGGALALLGITVAPAQTSVGAALAPPAASAQPAAPARGGVLTNVGPITPTGQIAFTRNATLYIMNAAGAAQHYFINFSDIDYNPKWSPDG